MIHDQPNVDFDALVRQARMQRSLAIGGAIAGVVGAASRAISRLYATIARSASPSFGDAPKSRTAER